MTNFLVNIIFLLIKKLRKSRFLKRSFQLLSFRGLLPKIEIKKILNKKLATKINLHHHL